MTPQRERWRRAWVVHVEAEPKHADVYPSLRHQQVLAVLPIATTRPVIEGVLVSLHQALVLTEADSDRFDHVMKEAPYSVEWNAVQRHAVLDYSGLPAIVAVRSRVRLVDAQLEWNAEPWPDGETSVSFHDRQVGIGRST